MAFFRLTLLPNNQPEIDLGYIRAKNCADAIKKTRKENGLSDKDSIMASRINKREILAYRDSLVVKRDLIQSKIYRLGALRLWE